MFDKNCFALFLEHIVPKGETPLETRQLRCLKSLTPKSTGTALVNWGRAQGSTLCQRS
jgi:hypothetical protein